MAKSKPAKRAAAPAAASESQDPAAAVLAKPVLAKPEPAKPPAEKPAPAKPVKAKSNRLDLVLARDAQVGDRQLKAGDKLASIELEPGVSMGYLAQGYENSLVTKVATKE